MKGHCAGEKSLSFGARPWRDVPAVASISRLLHGTGERATFHCARCFSGGASRELAARARRAALAVVGLGTVQGHCAGERPLSFGAQPRRDVPAVASISRLLRGTRERATALAVSLEEAQHANFLRARAVPRSLSLACALLKGTVPANSLSPSARGRGVTWQLRLSRSDRLSSGTHKRATALAVSQEEAQRASLLRAMAVPR